MKIDTEIMKRAMREHEVEGHGEAYGIDIPDDCLNDVAARYERMTTPDPIEEIKNARRIADHWDDLNAKFEKERKFQEEATHES